MCSDQQTEIGRPLLARENTSRRGRRSPPWEQAGVPEGNEEGGPLSTRTLVNG